MKLHYLSLLIAAFPYCYAMQQEATDPEVRIKIAAAKNASDRVHAEMMQARAILADQEDHNHVADARLRMYNEDQRKLYKRVEEVCRHITTNTHPDSRRRSECNRHIREFYEWLDRKQDVLGASGFDYPSLNYRG
ncbi:MAG: hypothetical protein K2X90_00275 [Candidatus Babeliaceae bacterium]|nr:hypothetical protein [Candidatus Babeliaceae bacterium]